MKFQKDRYAQRGIFPSKQHGETEENEENTIMALDGGGRQKKSQPKHFRREKCPENKLNQERRFV